MKSCRMLAAALFAITFSTVWADGPTAQLVHVSGKVEVQRGGGAWEPAVAGGQVAEGDRIHAGWKGTATIGFPDGSVVEVQPMSLIALEKVVWTGGTSRSRILLRLGELKAQVHKIQGAAGDFQVRTPTTTASVRGTRIERISYDPGAGTQIRMGSEGLLAVLTPQGHAFVRAHQASGVGQPGSTPLTPPRWEWIRETADLSPAGATGEERQEVRELGVPKTVPDGGSLAAARAGQQPDVFAVQPRPVPPPPPTMAPAVEPSAPPSTPPSMPPPTMQPSTPPSTPPNQPPGTSPINTGPGGLPQARVR